MQLMDFWLYNFSRFKLPIIVVYKYPSDYPESFVARLFDVDVAQKDYIVKDTLEGIREAIPPMFYRLDRHESDDPVICEIWV